MALRLALAIVLSVVVAVLCFALDASAQRRGGVYGGITVFEHPDFRGDSVTFREPIADLRAYGLNDRISSLEMNGNQVWEVCQDINFGGRCRAFDGTIDDLRQDGWNDRISSMRPAGFARNNRPDSRNNRQDPWWGNQRDRNGRWADSRLTFYDGANYRGQSRDVLGSSGNLGSAGERARSVQVYGGTWELCDGAFRNARCVTIDASVRDLRNLGLRDGVASVRELSPNASRRSRGWWW
jgi:hypothetical protein